MFGHNMLPFSLLIHEYYSCKSGNASYNAGLQLKSFYWFAYLIYSVVSLIQLLGWNLFVVWQPQHCCHCESIAWILSWLVQSTEFSETPSPDSDSVNSVEGHSEPSWFKDIKFDDSDTEQIAEEGEGSSLLIYTLLPYFI